MRISILIIILALASVAHADVRADADVLARRGVALYNLGKYEDAIAAFEAAYELVQSDALLFNLAQAHRQLDHCAIALQYYRRFLGGAPAPTLAKQVEELLPKLEAACRAKDERPQGPTSPTPPPSSVTTAAASPPEGAPAASAADDGGDSVTETAAQPSASPTIIATAAATGGTVIAGRSGPTAGIKLTATARPPWLHGVELGGGVGVGKLWRGDPERDAMLASITAVARYHGEYAWGRITIGGELGASFFSSLDTSSGVVPGVTRAGQWAPLARAEVGAEHDVAHSLAVRAAVAAGISPRTGMLLVPVTELDLLLGVRYSR
jgi:hypothetical protein